MEARKIFFMIAQGKSIVLESLVTFCNMELGTFFRNRDLVTIFRRLTFRP
jgi:hypothetical protein